MKTREEVLEELTRLRRVVVDALLGRLPAASIDFDRTRLDAEIFDEVMRIRKLVLRRVISPSRAADGESADRAIGASISTAGRGRGGGSGSGKTAPRVVSPSRPMAKESGRRKSATAAPNSQVDDQALRVFESLQLFVLQHPVAAQKVFSSLVAEGRRYAKSEEGARWARALGASTAVRRARQLWESSVASVLDDNEETVLPSEYVELLLQGAKLAAPEELGARISDRLGEKLAPRADR